VEHLYLYYVIAVMLVLPVACIVLERSRTEKAGELWETIGKWFVFWALGVRCLTAGISQSLHPGFTASLLQVPESSFVVIRELGFANTCMGLTGVISLFASGWRRPAGFCAGLFLGIAGILHITRIPEGINTREAIAMVSDLAAFFVVGAYLLHGRRSA
jgi:hypothetical protein